MIISKVRALLAENGLLTLVLKSDFDDYTRHLLKEAAGVIRDYRLDQDQHQEETKPATYLEVATWLEGGHATGVTGNKFLADRIRDHFGKELIDLEKLREKPRSTYPRWIGEDDGL